MNLLSIKYEFIPGLDQIVFDEIKQLTSKSPTIDRKGIAYTSNFKDIEQLKLLRSVNNIYYSITKFGLTPEYLNKNISELFYLIDEVFKHDTFKSFNLNCAGSESWQVRSIQTQIEQKYKIEEAKKADLQINLGKVRDLWELSVRITNRPLSLRHWRVRNIEGGLNPTIAYAMNYLSNPQPEDRYLNIFSGSGTLMIERALWQAKDIIGFDRNGLYNSYAAENAKKAGVIKSIKMFTHDIEEEPQLGKFDVITANLPFGIQQSKGEDLRELYKLTLNYSLDCMSKEGRLILYTANRELLDEVIRESDVQVSKSLDLEVFTSINSILMPKIYLIND